MKRLICALFFIVGSTYASIVNSPSDLAPKVVTVSKLSSSGAAVGAIYHASASNAVSWLAAPATGRLLGSQGVGVAPAWLTDPSVNSLTVTGTTGLFVTGTPNASATEALLQVGAAPVGGSSNGHMVNINAPSGFTGNLMRAQVNGGTNVWNVNSSGGGYFASSVGFGVGSPVATVNIDQADPTATTEKAAFRQESFTQTLGTSTTLTTARGAIYLHPVFTASGAGSVVTNAATLYVDQGPSASSAGGFTPTITNSYAFWVDSGTTALDGPIIAGSTLTVTGATTHNGAVTNAAATNLTGVSGSGDRLVYVANSTGLVTPVTVGTGLSFSGGTLSNTGLTSYTETDPLSIHTSGGSNTLSQDLIISSSSPTMYFSDTTGASDNFKVIVDGSTFSVEGEGTGTYESVFNLPPNRASTTPASIRSNGGLTIFSDAPGANYGLLTLGTIKVLSGTGTPEGAVTAPKGSLFLRDDGGAGTSMYIKESGSGNTGWAAK